jgi:polyferredoxin
MADYKSCIAYQKRICPIANRYANHPNVKLDCSKCKCYIAAENDESKQNIASEIRKVQNHDSVNHPSHYTAGGIECIDCIKAALGKNFIGFLIGNVIKYSYRYKDKNGVEDLKKARWYLDRAIKEFENEQT